MRQRSCGFQSGANEHLDSLSAGACPFTVRPAHGDTCSGLWRGALALMLLGAVVARPTAGRASSIFARQSPSMPRCLATIFRSMPISTGIQNGLPKTHLLSLCLALALVAPRAQTAQATGGTDAARAQILAPLEQRWGSMDEERQRRWLALATTYDGLTPGRTGPDSPALTGGPRSALASRNRPRERYPQPASHPARTSEILRDKWGSTRA